MQIMAYIMHDRAEIGQTVAVKTNAISLKTNAILQQTQCVILQNERNKKKKDQEKVPVIFKDGCFLDVSGFCSNIELGGRRTLQSKIEA